MKTCARCGEKLEEHATTCPKCGADVKDKTASFAPVPAGEKELTGEVPSAEGPVLVVRKGPDVGETFYLDRSELTIGRDPDADIFLNDVTVSRRHAKLTVAEGDVTVEDTDSLNGTYVNGVLVDRAVLCSGDSLQIGRFQMVFMSGGGE
jgi:pSer/pThr/pTyr-binding forkhead associated (FHA) protein